MRRSTDSLDKIWIESRYTAKTNSNEADSLSEVWEKGLAVSLREVKTLQHPHASITNPRMHSGD
jgi:hypothetical protein